MPRIVLNVVLELGGRVEEVWRIVRAHDCGVYSCTNNNTRGTPS